MKFQIKYRNGIPTRLSLDYLFKDFFGERYSYKIYQTHCYGQKFNGVITSNILWSDDYIQSKIYSFIDYLASHNIMVNSVRDYKSPLVGSLQITPKTK